MRVEYSIRKDALNRRDHGISLQRAEDFDFEAALEMDDDSQEYGEARLIAIGFIDANLYVLVYTLLDETTVRAISLRKAVASERTLYAEH